MRFHRFSKWLCGAVASATAIVAAPPSANAEEALALDRFNPAPAGDRMFGVQSPYAAGDPGIHLMLLGDYAHNPLVIRRNSDNEKIGAVVSSQLFLHLNANLALWSRLAINVDVPVALFQAGDDPSPDAATKFISPSSAQFGDLRLGARLVVVGDYFDAVQLAIGGYVWLPTGSGDDGSFVSDGEVRGLPQLIIGGRTDRFVWSGTLGSEIRATQSFAGIPQGKNVHGGLGAGFLFGERRQLQLGAELTFSALGNSTDPNTTNAEVLFDARYRFLKNFEAGIGAGPGLTTGLGTPAFRAVGMLAYTPEQVQKKVEVAPTDRDKDGIKDKDDACADVAGIANDDPKKHGCPPSDRDNDSILDEVDACPDAAGVANQDPKKHGCPLPPDSDKDGILDEADACVDVAGVEHKDPKKNGCPSDKDSDGVLDTVDACPAIPGLTTTDPATNGCPGDTDGDTVRDDLDACPNDKGIVHPNAKRNGCPLIRVGAAEVFILEQVEFDTDRATIKKVSDPLLDKVAVVLKDHPELTKIEVQGHTDNTGDPKHNEKLSQNRANAVMAALVKRKVAQKRLTAKGYGQSVPIDTNDTPDGKQNNRRVQFKITERAPKK